jgi:cell division inhibitor SulA
LSGGQARPALAGPWMSSSGLPRNHVATFDDRSNMAVLQVMNKSGILAIIMSGGSLGQVFFIVWLADPPMAKLHIWKKNKFLFFA